MFLKYRPARLEDLEECAACVRDRFAYDAGSRQDLTAFWREGLRGGALNMLIMEDGDAPSGRRILYFVFKACVHAEYAVRLRSETPPTLGRHVLDLWRRGESPLLTLPAIRAVNSGRGAGLNMMTVHNGSWAFFGVGSLDTVMNKMVEWAAFSTSGYRLQEYFVEVYGPKEWAWCEGMGMRLRRDYAADGVVPPEIPPDKSPRLYSTTIAEARQSLGTGAAVMFQWQPPCFFFSPSEQELLLCALAGDTDEELAAQLCVAAITVKKRWEGLYKRVETADSEFFGASGVQRSGQRGGEKKRRLLAYLRHHMEELRPLPPHG